MNGSSTMHGDPAATVIRKNVGHPSDSATFPPGATRISRLAAMRLESSANSVAENRRLHMLMM